MNGVVCEAGVEALVSFSQEVTRALVMWRRVAAGGAGGEGGGGRFPGRSNACGTGRKEEERWLFWERTFLLTSLLHFVIHL